MRKFLIAILACLSLEAHAGELVKGNGVLTKEFRDIAANYSKVSCAGPFTVFINEGLQDGAIALEGEANILEKIDIDIKGQTLRIGVAQGFSIQPGVAIKISFNAQNLAVLETSGIGSIFAKGVQNKADFKAISSGAGEIRASVNAEKVQVLISGGGTIGLSGKTDRVEATLTGAGTLAAPELKSDHAKIQVSGAGEAVIFATKQLEPSIAGSGLIAYKGGAQVINKTIAGSGKVKKLD